MPNAIYVKLIASNNTYITYPAYGLLEIQEFGTTGSIINAGFRQAVDGRLGALVSASNPRFEYAPDIANEGHSAVVDLASRQRAGNEHHSYPHTIIVRHTDDVLHHAAAKSDADMFCTSHDLRIEETHVHTDKEACIVYVYPTIGTKALTAIYATLCNDESSTDEELQQHFIREFGLTPLEARQQIARRDAALKAGL